MKGPLGSQKGEPSESALVLVRCGSRSRVEEGEQGKGKGTNEWVLSQSLADTEGVSQTLQVDRGAGLRWEALLLGSKRPESVGASQGEGGRYRQEGSLYRGRERLGAGTRAEGIV